MKFQQKGPGCNCLSSRAIATSTTFPAIEEGKVDSLLRLDWGRSVVFLRVLQKVLGQTLAMVPLSHWTDRGCFKVSSLLRIQGLFFSVVE